MRMRAWISVVAGLSLLTSACGGGDSSSSTVTPPNNPSGGRVYSDPSTTAVLTAANVSTVVSQAVAEAQARGVKATIAVTDRVGNVLAVYQMAGAAATAHIPEAPDGSKQDAQGLDIPAAAGAIAKAITGAYLSSSGNAFSTRTASQIVQEHFPPSPSAVNSASGPLFGVQFSQLPCSDLNTRFVNSNTQGPKRSPLGLAADPGGFPLYINGVNVGGVGVIADGVYGLDPNSQDTDTDTDEYVALAATQGFEAPAGIRAIKIDVGVTLRYSDADYARLAPANGDLSLTNPSVGAYVAVGGYYTAAGPLAGTPYGVTASGYRPATTADFSDADAYVLTNPDGTNRFPAKAAADGAGAMTQAEVTAILEEAFKVLKHERAAIREPNNSRSQVTISVVDRNGAVLGIVRAPDAPIFGTDVSLQKARTAAFFSSATAASDIDSQPTLKPFMDAARAFFNPAIFTGANAWGDRSIGSISRPFFPDGEPGTGNGPFSYPIAKFNPFATGLQSALIIGNLATELTNPGAQPATCTFTPRLANGIQIFPGSVPIYRGATLVGGIGVSGDGVGQDDMVGYLGLYNAGVRLGSGSGIANAPVAIRSNTLTPPRANAAFLQYVLCPPDPFVDNNDQNPCPTAVP